MLAFKKSLRIDCKLANSYIMEVPKLLDLVFDLFQRQIQIASFQNKQKYFFSKFFFSDKKIFC